MDTVLFSYLDSTANRVTGISAYAYAILGALAKRRTRRYVLLTNWAKENVPLDLDGLGVTYEYGNRPKSEKLALVGWYASERAAKRHGASLIFYPTPLSSPFGAVPRVNVVHDLYLETHPEYHSWHQRMWWNAVFPAAIKGSAAIVAVSNATRDTMVSFYPQAAAKTTIVHEAPIAIAPERVAADEQYALVVANVSPNKDFTTLIAALRKLAARGVAPKVYWVGRDSGEHVANLLAEGEKLENFVALGSVDQARLNALYAGASFYINSSTTEGFCIPIVEAQAAGLPVVCTDIPVLREVGGDGALFFAPGDADAMAAHIAQMWSDDAARNALAVRAQTNAKRFSWDRAAEETEAVFDAVLKRRSMSQTPAHAQANDLRASA